VLGAPGATPAAAEGKADPSVAANGEEEPEEGAVDTSLEEELAMMTAMGIPTGFDSTQGKGTGDPRCKMEGMRRKEVRKYRQYMNRRGGFNRPLDQI
jgi:U4/U6.U5 tri-snRNP-associated protein 3